MMKQTGQREPQFLYEEVARSILDQVNHGTFKPGEKIPSVRVMKEKLGLSVSTILEAYRRLEDKGILEARPQSGYYIRLQRKELPPAPSMTAVSAGATTVDISELAMQVHEHNLKPELVPLGTAVPANAFLPTKKLNRLMSSLGRHREEQSSRYEPISGNVELRRQIAQRSITWGGSLSPEDIIITTGCTEGLNLCLRAVAEPGDTVVVESPTYYGVLQILEALRLKAIEVPTDPEGGISLNALSSVMKRHRVAAVLVQPNCHNPLGGTMPEKNKKELVALMEKHRIPIIEDDTYGDLTYDGQRPKLLKAYDRTGNVLSCMSFSKTLCPGFRLGWTAPGRFAHSVRILKMTTSISSATLPQMALAGMLATNEYDRYLRRIRRVYKSQMETMIDTVKRYFPEGTKMTRPVGGIVLWVELPRNVDAMELYRRALSKNVSILPGELFSPNHLYKHCLRLNCAFPWSDVVDRALVHLGQIATALVE